MKKLLLLVGLVVFLTPSLVSAESLEEQLAEYAKKYCNNKSAILHPDGYFVCGTQQYKERLLNQNNTTSLTNVADSDLFNSHCVVNEKRPRVFDCKQHKNSTMRKMCTESEKRKEIKEFYNIYCFCENLDGGVYNVNGLNPGKGTYKENHCKSNSIEITYGKYLELKGYLPKGKYKEFAIEKYIGRSFKEFARALGCNPSKKNVDDCVRRYLPSVIGSGPMTMDQVDEIRKDKELMGEIVLGISLMRRAQDETHGPTEEEQRQAQEQEQAQAKAQGQGQAQQTEGHYKEQSDGQYVWVDTRSGYEKFTDNFCVGCNATQVYMINRATKRYYQGAPLSGWDKFVLRGGNSRRVIKFY